MKSGIGKKNLQYPSSHSPQLQGKVNAPEGLVIRKEPSRFSGILGRIPYQHEIVILEMDKWATISYDNMLGYALSKYIDLIE